MDVSTGGEFYPLYHYQFRLITLGDSTVGKSSLLRYFAETRTAGASDPTVGIDFYARLVQLRPDYAVKLQLFDTAGQEKFKSITRSYYRNCVGVIIVYDITNRASFTHVMQWLEDAEANVGGPAPHECVFLLVGHKLDAEAQREVLYEEGEYFAKYHKFKFIETSAVSGENVNEAFTMVAREVNAKLEAGVLSVADGWEGIRSGLLRQSISLADSAPADASSCPC